MKNTSEPTVVKMTNMGFLAFFLAGLLNNSSYVIMIAGAKDISPEMVGLVYVVAMVPSFVIKVSGPYWFHLVDYRTRIFAASVLMAGCFCMVAVGGIFGFLELQLFGVVLGSTQQGFGEASFLAYTAFFESRVALTAWSSGTGVAGIFGYAWVVIFTLGFGASFELTLFCANILPVLFWLNYVCLFTIPSIAREGKAHQNGADGVATAYQPITIHADNTGSVDDNTGQIDSRALLQADDKRLIRSDENVDDVDLSAAAFNMTLKERMDKTLELWPFMIPLFVVYFAEYAMQSGVWAAIGFPVDSDHARDQFYIYSNWMYQVGVFVSRSSGMLWRADMKALWTMPTCQLLLLVFFILDAYFKWWYDWSLLLLCFVVGLFGGAVYVGGYSLMAESVEPHLREFSLSASGVSVDIGVACADIAGIMIQKALYDYHDISD
jgi:battenin